MNFIEELRWRGQIQDMTPGLEEALQEGPMKAYVGFDPTAPSLTIGNLVSIMLLVRFQQAGHTPYVLMGGATGRIGDPSFKDEERSLKTTEEVERNLQHQAEQFRRFLDYTGPQAVQVVNNYDFYTAMNAIDFLRDVGKQITVNYMMSKESVKRRIETGISFTEFSYQLLQGYDFQHLYEKEGVHLQMGGSDQWGNLMTGVDFIRRNGGKAYALTCPLLTKADGKKFGKSEEGNIWLDAALTSPFKFYQFFINSSDADIPRLLRTFSLKSKAEIEALETTHAEDPGQRLAQKALAEELTIFVHGEAAYRAALKATEIVFSKKLSFDFLEQLSADEWAMICGELETVEVDKAQLDAGCTVVDLLAGQHSSLQSKGDVRRAIKNKALALNTEKVAQAEQTVHTSQLLAGTFILAQNGKKNKFVLQVK